MEKRLGEMELERKDLPIGKTTLIRKSKQPSYKNRLGEVDCESPLILRLSGEDQINRGVLLAPIDYEFFKKITDRLGILLDGEIPNNEDDYLFQLDLSSRRGSFERPTFREYQFNGGSGYFQINPFFPNKGRNFPKFPQYRNKFSNEQLERFEEQGFLFSEIERLWREYESRKDSKNGRKLVKEIKGKIEDMGEIWTESFWYKGIMLDYENKDGKKVFSFFGSILEENLLGLEEKRLVEVLESDGFSREIILETLKEPVFKLSINQIKKSLSRQKKEIEDKSPRYSFF